MSTNIPYLDEVWNLTRGCTKVSAGCKNCYAETLGLRFRWGVGKFDQDVLVELRYRELSKPLHWRKPRRVGVCFMSDLFHEKVPDEFLDRVFAVMALTPQHTYVLLTKRPERMREYLRPAVKQAVLGGGAVTQDAESFWGEGPAASRIIAELARRDTGQRGPFPRLATWPLPNVWLGVSVENQQAADERIPLLLETPGNHWVSCEPLLGPVALSGLYWTFFAIDYPTELPNPAPTNHQDGIDWVVVGGESGPKARECEVQWIADIAQQCLAADVPFYCKQDTGPRPGQQGRIPDALWAVKQLPGGWA